MREPGYERYCKAVEQFMLSHDDWEEYETIMKELVRLGRVPVDCSPKKSLSLAYKYAKKIKLKLRDDMYKRILEMRESYE